MVDSRPWVVGPPSTISGIRPPRLARTCSARVGLILPLALADGAASGRRVASRRSRIAGWAGQRTATVASPAVTIGATGAPSPSGSTSVSGPGQKRVARSRAAFSNFAISSA